MGRLETRFVHLVVAMGILTTLSVLVADLGADDASESADLSTANTPPASRALPANDTVARPPACPAPPCSSAGSDENETLAFLL